MFSDGETQTIIITGWDELTDRIEKKIDAKKKAIKDTEEQIMLLECKLHEIDKMKEAAYEGKKIEIT